MSIDDFNTAAGDWPNSGRRSFLVATGSVLTLTALPVRGAMDVAPVERRLVAFRPELAESVRFASELTAAGFTSFVIGPDPMRAWRDGLGSRLAEGDAELWGLTGWTDYLVLRSLAYEVRRYPRYLGQHSVDRDSVRHRLPGIGDEQGRVGDWGSPIARLLLEVAPSVATASLPLPRGNAATYFSWRIA